MSWKIPERVTVVGEQPPYWNNPPLSIDNNLNTGSESGSIDPQQWTPYLQYDILDSGGYRLCDEIRILTEMGDSGLNNILQVDIETSEDWVDIHNGPVFGTRPDWCTISIPGRPAMIDKIRIRFCNGEEEEYNTFFVYEVQYNQVGASRPLVNGSLVKSTLVTGGLTRCI